MAPFPWKQLVRSFDETLHRSARHYAAVFPACACTSHGCLLIQFCSYVIFLIDFLLVMASWYLSALGVLGVFINIIYGDQNIYENHILVELIPRNSTMMEAVRNFENPHVEILKRSHGFRDSLDLLVPLDQMSVIEEFANKYGILFNVKERNYGRKFETALRASRRYLRGCNIFGYNSNAAIQDYIQTVASNRPDLVRLQTLGKSYEGRTIRLVRISSNPDAGNPIIMVDAGIHAREWVAPAMALYIIHRLTSDPSGSQELNGVDWHILPLVNPDGYEYTRSNPSHRMWRKTRSKSPNDICYGVDGNRNYGFKWGVSGISKNPCDKETYAGPKPFSEPETKLVRNAMMQYAKRLKLYVSLHAYGNYLVYPWGYTGNYLPKQWKKLDDLAKKVSYGIQRVGGQPLKVLSAGKWYAAAGGSDDFAFGSVGVPYSYTMELTEGYEFELPEYLLKTMLPQFYEGFKVFGAEINKEFGNGRYSR